MTPTSAAPGDDRARHVVLGLVAAGVAALWMGVSAPDDAYGGAVRVVLPPDGKVASGRAGDSPPWPVPPARPLVVITKAVPWVQGPTSGRTPDESGDGIDSSGAAPSTPAASLQALIGGPLSGETETALLAGLRDWSDTSAAGAALWIESAIDGATPGSAADVLRHSLLYLWLEIEPEIAVARVASLADPDELPHLLANHAMRLADELDPEAALAWAETSVEGEARALAARSVLDRWLERDAESLAAYLDARLDGDPDASSAESIIGASAEGLDERLVDALGERTPELALHRARRLPAARADEARRRVANAWFDRDPGQARDWIHGVLASGERLPDAIAGAVPASDLEFAMTTWTSLRGTARDAMVRGIVETLSIDDPGTARAWVDSLPEPGLRASASRAWTRANASRMPAEALAGALAAPPDERRPTLLLDTAATVAETDPGLLEQWLASAPLDARIRSLVAGSD